MMMMRTEQARQPVIDEFRGEKIYSIGNLFEEGDEDNDQSIDFRFIPLKNDSRREERQKRID